MLNSVVLCDKLYPLVTPFNKVIFPVFINWKSEYIPVIYRLNSDAVTSMKIRDSDCVCVCTYVLHWDFQRHLQFNKYLGLGVCLLTPIERIISWHTSEAFQQASRATVSCRWKKEATGDPFKWNIVKNKFSWNQFYV